ncbi:MAG TPA: hypothetical protein VLB01_02110 [Thermodesulfobacteriota bacterium]|nr:hypothetical protein [Thermodesulfobacteriota bacterium]
MKIIYKRLTTKSGGEQDVLYVSGRCVITHNLDLDTYLYSSKEDWLRKYGKAKGKTEKEIDADYKLINRLGEIGQMYTDPRGKIHDVDNNEFRELFDSLVVNIR